MAAKSIASFTIGIGLLNVPVGIYSAVRDDRVALRQMCAAHKSRIEQRTICKAGGEVVEKIVKGYEVVGGEYVILTEDDLASAALDISKRFMIEACVPAEALDPRYFDKPYFVLPQAKDAGPAYVLLRDALRASARIGIGRVTIRSKQHIAALGVIGDALVLQLLHWPDELVDMGEYAFPAGEANPAELAMARQLVGALPSEFQPEGYKNQYRLNLEALIEAKIEGRDSPFEESPEPDQPAAASLFALLQASVDQIQRAAA